MLAVDSAGQAEVFKVGGPRDTSALCVHEINVDGVVVDPAKSRQSCTIMLFSSSRWPTRPGPISALKSSGRGGREQCREIVCLHGSVQWTKSSQAIGTFLILFVAQVSKSSGAESAKASFLSALSLSLSLSRLDETNVINDARSGNFCLEKKKKKMMPTSSAQRLDPTPPTIWAVQTRL